MKLLLPLVLVAVGCAQTRDPAGLRIIDPFGIATAEEEAALTEAWNTWFQEIGPDRLYLDRIYLRPLGEPGWALRGRGVALDLDDGNDASLLRQGLCQHLDEAEGHTAAAPELFGEDARFAFFEVCGRGAPDVRWRAQVVAACGTDELDGTTAWLADEVYLHADPGRVDGELVVVEEARVRWKDQVGAVGERLLVGHDLDDPEVIVEDPELAVALYDPRDGTEQAVATLSLEPGDWPQLSGGPAGGLVSIYRADHRVFIGVDADGSTREVAVEGWLDRPVRVGDRVYARQHDLETAPLLEVDLETGSLAELPIPEPEAGLEMLVSDLMAWEDRLVVGFFEAKVQVGGLSQSVTIGVFDTFLATWSAEEETWVILSEDLDLMPVGVTSDGLMWGELYSEAGRVVAAYDLEEDALLVSDEVCVGDEVRGAFAGGGRAAWFTESRSVEPMRWDLVGLRRGD